MRTFGERPVATLEIDVLADVVPRLQDAEPRPPPCFGLARILPPFRIREGRPFRARLLPAQYRRPSSLGKQCAGQSANWTKLWRAKPREVDRKIANAGDGLRSTCSRRTDDRDRQRWRMEDEQKLPAVLPAVGLATSDYE